jgi:hypothetical protein
VRLIYKPEGQPEQSWTFRPGKLRRTVASQLQSVYGKPWDVFTVEVQQGNIDARAVALWHCMRTEHPLLKFGDLPDFAADEVLVEYEADELRELLTQAETQSAQIPADQREMALGMLRAQLAEAEEREGPKASSTSSTPA